MPKPGPSKTNPRIVSVLVLVSLGLLSLEATQRLRDATPMNGRNEQRKQISTGGKSDRQLPPFLRLKPHLNEITVNSFAQSPGAVGDCTLGEAIDAANLDTAVDGCNAGTGPDTIILPAGVYSLTKPDHDDPFFGATGLPGIVSEVTIQGAGRDSTIIQRDPSATVPFGLMGTEVLGGTSVRLVLNDLTMRGSRSQEAGGALALWGQPAIITNVNFTDNYAQRRGGAIESNLGFGLITINNCVFANNRTTLGSGGAIQAPTLNVSHSTFDNNSAFNGGGALYFVQGGAGQINITDSSFINNYIDNDLGAALTFSGKVKITHSVFDHNSANGVSSAGAIRAAGIVEITDSAIINNEANDSGGLILSGSSLAVFGLPETLKIYNCNISNNHSRVNAGGLRIDGSGPLTSYIATISNSTISGNTANFDGGGISTRESVDLTIINTTIDGNTAHRHGGGIYSTNPTPFPHRVSLNNVTLSANLADDTGGGLFRANGDEVDFRNSLIALNTDTGGAPDIYAPQIPPIISRGYNLIGIKDGANVTNAIGDQTGTAASPINPFLGPLQNNGGPSFTRALLSNSSAIDAGNPAVPGSGGDSCEAKDQRGTIRPTDGNGDDITICDIGAAEVGAPPAGLFQFNTQVYGVGEGTGVAVIQIDRFGGSVGTASVTFTTSDNSAQAGDDYTALTTTVVFADGEIAKTVNVAIVDDALVEPNEVFKATLSNPTGGAAIGTFDTASITIIDNDAVPTPTPTPPCISPPPNLQSWWQFEGNGQNIFAGSDAQLVGNPSFMSGRVGQALSFDDIDDYAKVSPTAVTDIGSGSGFTIEGWINPPEIFTARPVIEWNGGPGIDGPHLWMSADFGTGGQGPGSLFVNIVDTSQGFHIFSSPPSLVVANSWQHIALTYDKSSGLAVIYLNGNIVAQQNLGSFTPQTGIDLYFGYRPAGVLANRRFLGGLDEVSLFNRALSPAEIQSIVVATESGKCRPAMVSVDERISVIDSQSLLPAAIVDVAEHISVVDQPTLLPATMIGVDERIQVTDNPALVKSALIMVNEQISVVDLSTVLPPAIISVNEQIRLSDNSVPLPSVLLSLNERISVVDAPTLLSSAMIAVNEQIRTFDIPVFPAPAVIFVAETIQVSDGPATLPSVNLNIEENIKVNDQSLITTTPTPTPTPTATPTPLPSPTPTPTPTPGPSPVSRIAIGPIYAVGASYRINGASLSIGPIYTPGASYKVEPASTSVSPVYTNGASYRIEQTGQQIGPTYTAGASYRVEAVSQPLSPVFTPGASYRITQALPLSPIITRGTSYQISQALGFTVTLTTASETAKQIQQTAFADLVVLSANTSDAKVHARLKEVADHLSKSLDPKIWTDSSHLRASYGDQFFNENKLAIDQLRNLIDSGPSLSARDSLQAIINRIATANRELALTAVSEAKITEEVTKHVLAIKELRNGDGDLVAINYLGNLDHYRKAWKTAVSILVCEERRSYETTQPNPYRSGNQHDCGSANDK